ncbi:site-2 protease family protein [Candidatus Thorarchaeota archaeon]|nr:MAG: site-2 protease family protein [Candidatus Thorarchaeota archaeon]
MSFGGNTRVISYPTFTELGEILSQNFDIISSSMEYGMPTFLYRWKEEEIPDPEQQRAVFDEVTKKAENLHVWPVVRWQNEDEGIYYTRFVPEEKQDKGDVRINYALFVATLGTIGIGGFLQATSPVFLTLTYPFGWTFIDIIFTTFLFVLALMGIIFTHEQGHYQTAKRRGIDATPPYFLPGLPQIGGTFGAFIQQKSPPKNRTDLFDLGIAGPMAGFAVTLVVLVVGFLLSVPVTAEELVAIDEAFPGMSGSLPVPYIFVVLEMVFAGFIPAGGTIYLHPVAFAGWVGCLVTALNLFPVGQLDGGHALRAIIADKKHKYIGYVAVAIMFLMGFYLMAILVIAMSARGGHPGPLEDTVPISKSRIALFVMAMVILALSIPPLGFSIF